MNKRIEYIDISKGLLILIVLFDHICWQVKNNEIENNLVENLMNYFFVFNSFFMSAFFFITGFCSSFNKNFFQFLYTKIKRLLIPALFLGAIQNIILLVLTNPESLGIKPILRMFLKMLVQIFVDGGQYWFLSAIFVANILFWTIYKIRNNYLKAILIILLYCIGVLLYNYNISNIWSIQQALLLLPFMFLGYLLKGYDIKLKYLCIPLIYIILIFIYKYNNISSPIIAARIAFESYWSSINFLVLGSLGSISIITISNFMRKINDFKLVEYIGKNSIIFYCLNWTIFEGLVLNCKNSLNNQLPYYSFIILCIIFISTVYLLVSFSRILNKKYINYMLGSF